MTVLKKRIKFTAGLVTFYKDYSGTSESLIQQQITEDCEFYRASWEEVKETKIYV